MSSSADLWVDRGFRNSASLLLTPELKPKSQCHWPHIHDIFLANRKLIETDNFDTKPFGAPGPFCTTKASGKATGQNPTNTGPKRQNDANRKPGQLLLPTCESSAHGLTQVSDKRKFPDLLLVERVCLKVSCCVVSGRMTTLLYCLLPILHPSLFKFSFCL